jgi:M6 family metalloprotease-like protein
MPRWFDDVSHGKFGVAGTVVGWYRAPEDDSYYEPGSADEGPRFGALLRFALERADADLDFGAFDNDGPDGRPNSGDDDGKVDAVLIVHPEIGGECGGAAKGNFGSHQWHFKEPWYGHTKEFATKDVCRRTDGKPPWILVDDYTLQPALACPVKGEPDRMIDIGVFCHELCHTFRLPDLYDRTPDGEPNSLGVGNWCAMGYGVYGGDGGSPHTPVHPSAWVKAFLGWARVQEVLAPVTDTGAPVTLPLSFEPVEEGGKVVLLRAGAEEYWLLEWREPTWKDASGKRVNWDEKLPGGGLAIWHVDERVGRLSPRWPMADLGRGQNDAPSLPGATTHSLVALEQADLRLHLERNGSPADSGDLWGANLRFENAREAGSRRYDGETPTGIAVHDIDLAARTAKVTLSSTRRAPPRRRAPWFGPQRGRIEELAADLQAVAGAAEGTDRDAFLDALSATARRALDRLTPAMRELLAPELDEGALAALDDLARSARFEALRPEREGESPPILDVLYEQDEEPRVMEGAEVLYGPERASIRWLSGVKIPADRVEEAVQRFGGAASEEGMRLVVHERDAASTSYRYMVSVEGRELPVFEAEAYAFQDEVGDLVAFRSEPPPRKLLVSGSFVLLEDVPEAIVEAATGWSPSGWAPTAVGVFVTDPLEGAGRCAYCVRVPVGEPHRDLAVFVDGATGYLLDIR